MSKFLPSKEVALKRKKKCRPWLVGLIVGLFAPANLLFSYRQRKLDYAVIYLILIVFIYAMREIFPRESPMGPFDFIYPSDLWGWLIHYQYGPAFLYGFISWGIAANSKFVDQGLFDNWSLNNFLKAFTPRSRRSMQEAYFEYKEKEAKGILNENIPPDRSETKTNTKNNPPKTNKPQKERLEELKDLFDSQLISEEEYELLRKKTLGL